MIVECIDRTGNRREHSVGDVDAKTAMERLGVYKQPFTVNIWPDGRPDMAQRVQTLHVLPEGNRVDTSV